MTPFGARLWDMFDRQRGALVLWVPVCLAIGIGAYLALPVEPGAAVWAGLGALCAAGATALAAGAWRWPLAVAAVLVLAGLLLGGARTALVAAPVLDWRYYGPVQGRIVRIDRSASDKPRLTLDKVVLDDVAPSRTPDRVRVSLHGPQDWLRPMPGQTILVTAHLGPPLGPVEPGGFDFRRYAWFRAIGAVGYTRNPALLLEPAGAARPVGQIRLRISRAVRAALPGETGAFAAAITTGDRSGMSRATLEALRASNLAHLLAISGLHMGLLTGVVFMALRLMLAAVPGLALSRPIKKYAAIGALICGACYLALSGGNVATQRAFVMMAVMFGAVLLDRRALTLRAVAVAAVIVLLLRPEALAGPGFQMSFAATTALVAVFGALRGRWPERWPGWLRPVLAVALSSAVAGAATAPVAAAHFNQIARLGLVANLLSVPLMGLVVMPGAVLAAFLAPLGLSWVGLALMAPAIDWILGVAHWVAALDVALLRVPSPGPVVLPLLALGGLWCVLWQGRARWTGTVPAVLAVAIWSQTTRPDLLIAASGGLIGVMTDEGRALSKPGGDGFAARSWLENDGDAPDQARAFARTQGGAPWRETADGTRLLNLDGLRIAHITGRGATRRVADYCTEGVVVVTSVEPPASASACLPLGPEELAQLGALAIRPGQAGPRVVTALERSGMRPWSPPQDPALAARLRDLAHGGPARDVALSRSE